jgi:hypothetical protein
MRAKYASKKHMQIKSPEKHTKISSSIIEKKISAV